MAEGIDKKTITGFCAASLFSLLSVLSAVLSSEYFVFYLVLAQIAAFLSVARAEKVHRSREK
ncbi:hypothetical protein QRD89_11235 [Halobacillus sp. ACCC02827]|uniref:hypothetical protein n=1 Tax=unclassified Halobacillus TaxID=2636472 RepID=UPI0002A50DC7|nr:MULTISPECIES: hypothetical protein [unclassified Halobacillus]ELK44896.1 hypothetical protein D479_17044 [Halobacillus sp. BAB-2008]WJE14299.1 hypothetical protein QRD89_11235 [Halobacillus sp. ACCC02827]